MAITDDTKLGNGVKVYHPELVNLYGCEIGDDCIVGAFVEIRRGVKIGNRVKIQAGTFIPEGVVIEDEVFIGPHVVFTNDLFPRAVNQDGSLMNNEDWEQVGTLVKKGASLGAGSVIRCGVTIGEGAMIGMGSVVLHDVGEWTVVAGNPAREIRKIDK